MEVVDSKRIEGYLRSMSESAVIWMACDSGISCFSRIGFVKESFFLVVLPFYNCVVMPNVRIMADVMQHSEISDNALENVNGSGVSDCALINVNGSGVSG